MNELMKINLFHPGMVKELNAKKLKIKFGKSIQLVF